MRTGRLNWPAPEIAQRYSESVSFDWRLYRYDIAGSIAHAAALTEGGIITADERQQIENELRAIEGEIESGKFEWDSALEVFTAMLPQLKISPDRMEAAANAPNLFATDLAEYLVKKGTPFREAHEIVGKLVAHAGAKETPLDQVPLAEMRKFSPLFDVDFVNVFDIRRSLSERRAIGAPSPENVAMQIKRWRANLRK
jgi:argininosuccinate lyase